MKIIRKIACLFLVLFFTIPAYANDTNTQNYDYADYLIQYQDVFFDLNYGKQTIKNLHLVVGYVLGRVVSFDPKTKDIIIEMGEGESKLQLKFKPLLPYPHFSPTLETQPTKGKKVAIIFSNCVDNRCDMKQYSGCYDVVTEHRRLKNMRNSDGSSIYDADSSEYMNRLMQLARNIIEVKKILCMSLK